MGLLTAQRSRTGNPPASLAEAELVLAGTADARLLAGSLWQQGPLLAVLAQSLTDGRSLATLRLTHHVRPLTGWRAAEWTRQLCRRVWKLLGECRARGVALACLVPPLPHAERQTLLKEFVPAYWGGSTHS